MKYKILFVFAFFYSLSIFGQTSNDKIIYLDSLDNPATETNYSYKRIIKDYHIKKNLYEVNEYYKSGGIKTIEISSRKNEIIPVGMIKEFYENGNKKKVINISNSKSHKNFEWYENGEKKSETETSFIENNDTQNIRVLQFWDKNSIQKVVDGNGEYELDNEYINEKGRFRNGNKNGEWIGRDKKHNFPYIENYADGKLISGKSIDSNQIQHHYTLIYKGFKHDKKRNKLFNEISGKLFTQKFDLATIIVNVDKEGKLSSIQTTPDISDKLGEIIKKHKHKTPIVYRGIAISLRIHSNLDAFSLTWQTIHYNNNVK